MEITYREVNSYLIPNIKLQSEETNITLGKWGMMYKTYLEKHKKVFFSLLISQGKLYQHCAEVENQARDMFDTIVEQMKENEGITEQLRKENQMEWVCRMQSIETMARELICYELIFN